MIARAAPPKLPLPRRTRRGVSPGFPGSQATALQHVFFAERQIGKIDGLTAAPRSIQSGAIIGAGTMGGGIAMCFADAGLPVTLVERESSALAAGLNKIKANYERCGSAIHEQQMSDTSETNERDIRSE